MKKRKMFGRRGLLTVMALMLFLSFWGESAKALPAPNRRHHVVMMYPKEDNLHVSLYLRDAYRSSSTNSGMRDMGNPFSLFAVPANIVTYEESKPYWRMNYRLYCVEGTGQPHFIIDLLADRRDYAVYTSHNGVIEEVNKTFEATPEDWALVGHAIVYNRYVVDEPRLNQTAIYVGLNQTTVSRSVYMPHRATEELTYVGSKNKSLHGAYSDFNLVLDMLSETRLMEKRIATVVPEKQKTITVRKPGEYQFDPIAGYAIPGMTAEVYSGDIVLPEKLMLPMQREDLLKQDNGYKLSFSVPKTAKNGTYTISVKRPDFSYKPIWTGFASDPDLQKSAQWCATVDNTLPMKEERFTVNVAMEKESSEMSDTSTASEASTSSEKSTSSQTGASSEKPTSSQTGASSEKPASSDATASAEAPTTSSASPSADLSKPSDSSAILPAPQSPGSTSSSTPIASPTNSGSSESALSGQKEDSSTSSSTSLRLSSTTQENPPEKDSSKNNQTAKNNEASSAAVTMNEEQAAGAGRIFGTSPITGDTLRIFLWGIVAFVAAAGLIVMEIIRRREE